MREYIVRCENNRYELKGEIVRCKDCKNRHRAKRCSGRHPDWFCGDGVKDEIVIKTGQTYGKSSNISKDIGEQIKKHVERIKEETDKNPDSLWSKGMRSFDGWEKFDGGEKQVTGKLNNLDDFLLREDLEGAKEKKSKLESDTISRQAAIEAVTKYFIDEYDKMPYKYDEEVKDNVFTDMKWVDISLEHNKGIRKVLKSLPPVEDMGEVSDGYHTFNQLYHQRAVLFATIANQNKDKAWKSWKHEDGKFCFNKGGEWFIVGVDTPEGSYTYHYENKYWDMFDCEELDRGKHWDGHTEEDVTRLLSLPPVEPKPVCEDCISRADTIKAMCADCEAFFGDDANCADCYNVAAIKSMPPVEPKRPKGEWVEYIDEMNGGRYGRCTSCNKSTLNAVSYDLNGQRYIMDFCPKCGCDCRGDKE